MKECEALKKLKAYRKCKILQAKGIYKDCNEKLCDNCDLFYAQGKVGDYIESIEVAIQALKKQIPKKPTYEGHQYANDDTFVWDEWICPCCEKIYDDDYDYDYCPNCGQKIDWSDKR